MQNWIQNIFFYMVAINNLKKIVKKVRQGSAATEKFTLRLFQWNRTRTTNGSKRRNKKNLWHRNVSFVKKTLQRDTKKVRGRCHITGKHMEAAYLACKVNVEISQSSFMPTFSIFPVIVLRDSFLNLY